MLTLSRVTSGAAAASYYEQRDDYYTEGGKAPSAWWGRCATDLGLEGPVDTAEFARLLDGKLPGGEELHHGGEGPRVGGLDLTFSAPKSVSLQAMVGDDRRLLQAHEEAVTATLLYVEQHLAAYRQTSGGETSSKSSGKVAVARFAHDLSRDADPQVHTHCVLLNVSRRDDGAWRALDAKPLYEQQKSLGAHYRAELALRVQALGYRIRGTHEDGRFELAHIDDAQVAAFSSRRQAIDAALEARGRDRETASARERELAGLATRRAKDKNLDRETLAASWRAKAVELGMSWVPLAPGVALSAEERKAAAAEAVTFAVAHLSEREAVMRRHKVEGAALARGTGSVAMADILEELKVRVEIGELMASADGKRFSTAVAQGLERELLDIEKNGRGALRLGIKECSFVRNILAGQKLSAGQRAAAESILTTRNRVLGVQGLAGTGKTRMLRAVKSNLGLIYRPVGLAPSAAAARELEAAGIPSTTVAAFLARSGVGLTATSVVVLDEAGMVSARDMHAVLQAVETAGARIVLVGDTRQLKAVEAGLPFAQLQAAGMETVRMADIQRQTNAALRAAVVDAAEGRVAASISRLAPRIAEVPYATDRHERIAKHYTSLLPADRRDTLVVAGTNMARARINDFIRHRLGVAGQGLGARVLVRRDMTRAQLQSSLSYAVGDIVEAQRHYDSIGLRRGDTARIAAIEPGRIELKLPSGDCVAWRPTAMPHVAVYGEAERELSKGDLVRFTANDYGRGIINGETGTVEGFDAAASTATIRTSKGELVTLDTSKALHLDHGYCTTVHAAQGQTCERVLIDADVSSAMASESLFYVAISRARSEVTIYTDDRAMLPEAMGREDVKTAALDLELTSKREAALSM